MASSVREKLKQMRERDSRVSRDEAERERIKEEERRRARKEVRKELREERRGRERKKARQKERRRQKSTTEKVASLAQSAASAASKAEKATRTTPDDLVLGNRTTTRAVGINEDQDQKPERLLLGVDTNNDGDIDNDEVFSFKTSSAAVDPALVAAFRQQGSSRRRKGKQKQKQQQTQSDNGGSLDDGFDDLLF